MKNITFLTLTVLLHGLATSIAQSQALLQQPQIKYTPSNTDISSMPFDYLEAIYSLDDSHKLVVDDYKELLELYEKNNYTPEVWKDGIREVPRLYITEIGAKWGTKSSKEVTVLNKKRLFFRGMTPMVLHANELILEDRNRLKKNIQAFELNNSLNDAETNWIGNLATTYEVEIEDGITMIVLMELKNRVDIIPASLALAQAAAESGWGTSRFMEQGNAMYGQWSWGKNAMVPEEQREHLGEYGVAAFGSIQESISAYMLNLNTHYAYKELREQRAELRQNGNKLSGYTLAEGLIHYSEKGETYIETIRSIMDYNQLLAVDDAFLKNEKPLYLFPSE